MAKQEKDRYRQIVGAWGEHQAAGFLLANGLQVLEKNYRTSEGEIDLIARDGDEIVFVEVKTRTNLNFGFPEEAVTEEKLEHLTTAAELYLLEYLEEQDWRIDVIAIQGKPGDESPEFEWFKDAR